MRVSLKRRHYQPLQFLWTILLHSQTYWNPSYRRKMVTRTPRMSRAKMAQKFMWHNLSTTYLIPTKNALQRINCVVCRTYHGPSEALQDQVLWPQRMQCCVGPRSSEC